MSGTITKFNGPIPFTYEYHILTGKGVRTGTSEGAIQPDQDSFMLNPGEKLTLRFPQAPQANLNWTASADDPKLMNVKDLGYKEEDNGEWISGHHDFLLTASANSLLPIGGTPVHFVLSNILNKKELAEKTLNFMPHFDMKGPQPPERGKQ